MTRCSSELRGDLIRPLDRCQMPPSGKYRQRRTANRFVQLLRHCHRRSVVLFTHNHCDRHAQRRQLMPQVSLAKHDATRGIAFHIVYQKYFSHRFH